MTGWRLLPFQRPNRLAANQKWDAAEHAKAAIDETPAEGDTADGAGDQGEGNYSGAGDEAEVNEPFVADWVNERANEGNRDHEVAEGQPVRSVGQEGKLRVGCR